MNMEERKQCQNCKKDFNITLDDSLFYEKIDVPKPKFCPGCRYKRRLMNRNEWNLYRRPCDLCKKNIISIYQEDSVFPVYCRDCWWSDSWDPASYGRDIDFSRPFFEQFAELHNVVPHIALVTANNVNSDYSNQSQNNKDCYMVSASNESEKCLYGNWFQEKCYFSADCYMVEKCEFCYECMSSARCSKCAYIQDCTDCVSTYFSSDCRGCTNCFGCVNLRNQSNCWFNEQLSKEDYQKKFSEFKWTHENIAAVRAEVKKNAKNHPKKFYHGSNNHNFSGDYLENTEATHESFNCRHNRECNYSQDAWRAEDCLDLTEILGNELSYQIQGCAHIRNSITLRSSFHMTDSYYCDMCQNLSNGFGCMAMRGGEYAILNRKYSKEEYIELKQRLIEHMKQTGEWGEFFDPTIIAPFAYNESVIFDYFPLSRTDAIAQGYAWYDRPEREYTVTKKVYELPKTIAETDDSIMNETIECLGHTNGTESPTCSKAFRIMQLELDFYRATGMPLPQKCFSCRRNDRFALRNPRTLWKRSCMKEGCQNEFETSYAPDRPEIVYCESCYQNEVV